MVNNNKKKIIINNILNKEIPYYAEEISFKQPSEHTVGTTQMTFPLELQISMISPDNVKMSIAVLFSEDDEDNEFLKTMGFGSGLLQHLGVD